MRPRNAQVEPKKGLVRVRICFESTAVHLWLDDTRIRLSRPAGQALAVLLATREADDDEPSEVDVFLRGEITR